MSGTHGYPWGQAEALKTSLSCCSSVMPAYANSPLSTMACRHCFDTATQQSGCLQQQMLDACSVSCQPSDDINFTVNTLFVDYCILLRWQMDCTSCTHKPTRSTEASVQRLFALRLLAHGSWQALALPCWQSLAAPILQKLPSTMMTAAPP